MTVWWIALGVAAIGVLAVKLDVGALLERRDRKKLARFQAECLHCEVVPGDDGKIVAIGRITSPPGTIRAQCARCGKVFGCLRDGETESRLRLARVMPPGFEPEP